MTALPRPLPLRLWPAFARAAWTRLRGEIELPDDKRWALGRYFAWLQTEGLPLDSTGEEIVRRYLRALEARMATKPGFHVALCHLLTALATVHPAVGWGWLRRWRRAWRRQFLPPPTESVRDLGVAPLPFSRWPAEAQQAWRTQAPAEWSAQKNRTYRAAYGRFLGFCARERRPLGSDRAGLEAYVARLATRLPQTGHTHLRALQIALAILFPATDWGWLVGCARAARPPPSGASRGKPSCVLSLAFEDWPLADQQRWRHAVTPPPAASRLEQLRRRRLEPRNPGARPSRCRPPHRWSRPQLAAARYAYGSFLKAMQRLGRRGAAVTPETVALWVEAMRARMTLFSAGNRVRDLGFALRILQPQGDWRWLQHDARLLQELGPRAHDKAAEVVDVREIRGAAVARLRRVADEPRTVRNALAFQDGLLMLLLSYRPIRRRNLADTRLGVHLIVNDGITEGRLCYARTKAGNRYEAELPAPMLPRLKRFLEVYRPLLAGAASGDAAWLSRAGRALTAKRLWRRIRGATQEELGKPLTLHRFRDCLASTVSELAPERIDDAAALLGHRPRPKPRCAGAHRTPAIETYRQRAGTTLAGRRLAEIEDRIRRPRRLRRAGP